MMHLPSRCHSFGRRPLRWVVIAVLALASCHQVPLRETTATSPSPVAADASASTALASPALTLREPEPWLDQASCTFAGHSGGSFQLSVDGTRAGVFVSVEAGADVKLEVGSPDRPARIRATVEFIDLVGRLASNDIQLFPTMDLAYQGVFHLVPWRRVRVRAVAAPAHSLQIAPKSWESQPVRFRSESPWIVPCDAFRVEAARHLPDPFFEKKAAWLEPETNGSPTTLAARPSGPPVLDVLRGMVVRVVSPGPKRTHAVAWDTEDGRFFAIADSRSLGEPPGTLGYGSGTGSGQDLTPNVGCTDSMTLYAVRESALGAGAFNVGTVPPEGNLVVLEVAPYTAASGEPLVYVEVPGVRRAPGIRFVVKDGPGVSCRRSQTKSAR